MKINMKGYEELKEKAHKEKAEISKTDLIKVCCRIANAAAELEDETAGILNASMEMLMVLDEFFPEEEEKKEEADAEKPAEKTELSAMEELLFERTHLRDVQYHTTISAVSLSRYNNLHSLIIDADLKEKYNFWKAVNGYE
jgi:hypothetical protein